MGFELPSQQRTRVPAYIVIPAMIALLGAVGYWIHHCKATADRAQARQDERGREQIRQIERNLENNSWMQTDDAAR